MHKLNGLLPLKLRDHCVSGNWDPMLVFGPGGALRVGVRGERLDSLICRWSRETDGEDLTDGRKAELGGSNRVSQTEEKPALIEKSTYPHPPSPHSLLLRGCSCGGAC